MSQGKHTDSPSEVPAKSKGTAISNAQERIGGMTMDSPDKIQVGYTYGSPASYEAYNDEGNFVGQNDAECKAFAAELQRRYNVHDELRWALEAIHSALGFIDRKAFNSIDGKVLDQLSAAIKLAEGE